MAQSGASLCLLWMALASTMQIPVTNSKHAMAKDLTPSTQWQENVAPDEAERFAGYGQQFAAIQETYKTPFYHPNFIIRLTLFVATLLALSGVTGFFGLIFFVCEVKKQPIYFN